MRVSGQVSDNVTLSKVIQSVVEGEGQIRQQADRQLNN